MSVPTWSRMRCSIAFIRPSKRRSTSARAAFRSVLVTGVLLSIHLHLDHTAYCVLRRIGVGLGRLVGFEPTTSRTTIWRYYQLSYSRRVQLILASLGGQSPAFFHRSSTRRRTSSLIL